MSGPSPSLSQVLSQWRAGQTPDALAVLANHPSMGCDKSLVLDLAYEEFCLRRAAGEELSVGTFCERFSHHGRSLQRLLEVHEYMAQHPGVVGPPEEMAWPSPGDEFLGFGIEKELGRGAFARVYRARQRNVGDRLVAVKLAWQGAAEADMMGKLSHPNIVPVYTADADVATGLTVVCMPYLGEKTLEDLLEAAYSDDRPPPLHADIISRTLDSDSSATASNDPADPKAPRTRYTDAVAKIMFQLADALCCTHQQGILHRDLKPSNVLLTADGTPMLLDFNLSTDSTIEVSRLGGTLPYMSPEQIEQIFFRGSAAIESQNSPWEWEAILDSPPDDRSDLFALGVVAYELLTGKLPFGKVDGRNVCQAEAQSLYDRQRQGAVLIRQRNLEVDPELADILHTCLQFDPEKRPDSAEALRESLGRYLSHAGRVRRVLHRNRFAVSGFAVTTAILLTIAAVWLAMRPPYSARAYESGIASYEQGDYATAIASFTEAIEHGDPSAAFYYARGMARLKENQLDRAIDDFHAAARIKPSGTIYALLAYCYALQNHNRQAVLCTQKAIDSGYQSAIVFNNQGRSLIELSQLLDAKKALDRAIELDGFLAESYHHRARLGLQSSDRDKNMLDSAKRDIDRALSLKPNAGNLLLAALIYAEKAQALPAYHKDVRRFLTRAIQQGISPNSVESFITLEGYCKAPWYLELREKYQAAAEAPPDPPFLLPTAEIRLP